MSAYHAASRHGGYLPFSNPRQETLVCHTESNKAGFVESPSDVNVNAVDQNVNPYIDCFLVMGAVYSQFMLPPFNPDYPSQPYENPPPPMNYPSFPPPPPPQQEQPQHNYTSPQYNTIPFRLPSQYPSQQSSYTPVQATSPMPPYYGPQSNYSANTSPMYRPTNPSYPQNFTPYPFRPSQTEYAQTSVNYSMPYDSPVQIPLPPFFPRNFRGLVTPFSCNKCSVIYLRRLASRYFSHFFSLTYTGEKIRFDCSLPIAQKCSIFVVLKVTSFTTI